MATVACMHKIFENVVSKSLMTSLRFQFSDLSQMNLFYSKNGNHSDVNIELIEFIYEKTTRLAHTIRLDASLIYDESRHSTQTSGLILILNT